MLATCSYHEYRPHMGLPVRTSLGAPKYPLDYELPDEAKVWEITPRWSYLRAPFDSYREQYLNQLHAYGVTRIQSRFTQLQHRFQAADLVILCFESRPDSWCHRRMFAAEFWLPATGEVIPELGHLRPTEED
jgi:hypothetical protein